MRFKTNSLRLIFLFIIFVFSICGAKTIEAKTLSRVKAICASDHDRVRAILYENGALYFGSQGAQKKILTKVDRIFSLNNSNLYAAIKKNGDLYCWGDNYYGQLGNGEKWTDKTTHEEKEADYKPVKVLKDVRDISIGLSHAIALTNNGDLYSWGDNTYGQLGDGTVKNCFKPKRIMTNINYISAGTYMTSCVDNNGSLYVFGSGFGDNPRKDNPSEVYSDTPIKVDEDVVQTISDQDSYAYIKTDGTLHIYGNSMFLWYGQSQGFIAENLNGKKVKQMYRSEGVFAVLTENGELIVTLAGTCACNEVISDVSMVYPERFCISYITKDSKLYRLGSGIGLSTGNEDNLKYDAITPTFVLDNVRLYSSSGPYNGQRTAITRDGSVYVWGSDVGCSSPTLGSVWGEIAAKDPIKEYDEEDNNYNQKDTSKWVNVPFEREMMIKWDWNDLLKDSTTSGENKNLAIAGLVMSRASEVSKKECESTLRKIGFSNLYSNHYTRETHDKNWINNPAMTFGHKCIKDGNEEKNIICAVFRGTEFGFADGITDVLSCINGFKPSGENGKEELQNYIEYLNSNSDVGCRIEKNNTILFLTGHSLGAATASVVTGLSSGIANDDSIFTYVFATPNYDTSSLSGKDIKNTHHYVNVDDEVPNMPAGFSKVGIVTKYEYAKATGLALANFTRAYKYFRNKGFMMDKNPLGLDVPLIDWRDHLPFTYMSFLMSGMSNSDLEKHIGGYMIEGHKAKLNSVKSNNKRTISVNADMYTDVSKVKYQFIIEEKNSNKAWVYKNSSSNKMEINGLKSKKEYNIRVRVYKKINGKTYYSSTSSKKTIKVK